LTSWYVDPVVREAGERIALGQRLETGGDVGGLTHDVILLAPRAGPDVTKHHEPGMDADPHGELDPVFSTNVGS
jgi:hypothetical protein